MSNAVTTTHDGEILDAVPVNVGNSANSLVLDARSMDSMLSMANLMAESSVTLPAHFRGKAADCLAVVMQSMQWRMNPFAVAQKTHIVNGTLGYEAQLVNAVVISMAPTKDRLHFDWFGDWKNVSKDDKSHDRGVRVWATLKGEDEPRELVLTMGQVGSVRNSPLWANDPRQQIAYLAIKRWSRLYCPDVILGVYTPDEIEEIDITPRAPARNSTPSQLATAAATTAPALTEDQKQMIVDLEEVARMQGAQALADNWQKLLSKDDRKAIGAAELARLKDLAQNADDDRAIAARDAAAAGGDTAAQDE